MNKIFDRIEDANNRLPPDPNAPLQPISVVKPLGPEAFAKQQEELRKPAGLLPVELSGIDGEVDTPEELESVLEWASTRRAHALGGKLAAMPRADQPDQSRQSDAINGSDRSSRHTGRAGGASLSGAQPVRSGLAIFDLEPTLYPPRGKENKAASGI